MNMTQGEPLAMTAADLLQIVLTEDASSPLNLQLPQGAKLDGLEVQPRLTRSFRHALGRMEYAVQRRSPLALIVGTHGGGKSTAARVYANSRKDTLLWEAPPGYNERQLMAHLCTKLAISAGEGFQIRTQVVVDHLRDHPRILIVDEAQRLTYHVLDQLKYIADQSKSTVILVGSPWLEQKIDRHSDISSRVWVRGRVEPLGLDEFRALYASEGFTPAVLDELHALTGGVLRVLTALLTHLETALAAQHVLTRETLTVAHVRRAAEVVI
jgi:DNA transposition AAA+ family ATPase